jgi:hypothetical protein
LTLICVFCTLRKAILTINVQLHNTAVKTTGYPFVSAAVNAGGDDSSTSVVLELTQARFLSSGVGAAAIKAAGCDDTVVWFCPVAVIVGNSATGETIESTLEFNAKTQSFTLPLPSGATAGSGDWWLKLNVGAAGFFRVQYDASLLQRLSPQVSTLPSSRQCESPCEVEGHFCFLSCCSLSSASPLVKTFVFSALCARKSHDHCATLHTTVDRITVQADAYALAGRCKHALFC